MSEESYVPEKMDLPEADNSLAASSNRLPFVSVIVPVYNSATEISVLISALRSQHYPQDRFEVIIVDDASTDSTVETIKACWSGCSVISASSNGGSYVARNLGLAVAKGSIIAFTDADCIPDTHWLTEGVTALKQQGGGIIAGAVTIKPDSEDSVIQSYDAAFGIQQAFFAKKLRFGATANIITDRSTCQKIGGFDGSVRSGGDRKFCQDGINKGVHFSYCAASIVVHPPRTTLRELFGKQIRISIGQAHIFPKWTRLYIYPMGYRDPDTLDRCQFEKNSSYFKFRFRVLYYMLEVLHLISYGWGCLRVR